MWCFLSWVSQDLGPVLRRVRVSRVPRQDRRVSASISSGENWTVTTSHPTQTACSSAASWLRSPPSTSKHLLKALELQIWQEQRYPEVFDVTGVECNILNLRKDVELKYPLFWPTQAVRFRDFFCKKPYCNQWWIASTLQTNELIFHLSSGAGSLVIFLLEEPFTFIKVSALWESVDWTIDGIELNQRFPIPENYNARFCRSFSLNLGLRSDYTSTWCRCL